MGERLLAKGFQDTVLRKFTRSFNSSTKIPDQGVCDLLEIASSELPARLDEDPLRAQIFWYAASRVTALQKYSYFTHLLKKCPDLGRDLSMRVGDGNAAQPAKPTGTMPTRFMSESIYQT